MIAPSNVVNPALGLDLTCTNDLTPTMTTSSGRQCLAEAIYRRMTTPRGGLIYDPNYGFDLTAYIEDDITGSDLGTIQAGILQQCAQDERIVSAKCAVQFVGSNQVTSATSGIVANPKPGTQGVLVVTLIITDSMGPFKLVVSASSLSVQLLQVSA